MGLCVLIPPGSDAAARAVDGPGPSPGIERVAAAAPPPRVQGGSTPSNPAGTAGPDITRIAPPVPMTSILDPNFRPIDLNTALRLAGVQNPELNLARQRVVEAAALRQLAAAQILPTINSGHELRHPHRRPPAVQRQHPLGQPQRRLRRGRGERGRGGHGEHPGRLPDRQHRRGRLRLPRLAAGRRRSGSSPRRDPEPGVPPRHPGLLRAAPGRGASGRRACRSATRPARVRLVTAYSKAGKATQADADRAATELARREADVQRAEGDILVASARLCEVLNLDPSIRLHPTDA